MGRPSSTKALRWSVVSTSPSGSKRTGVDAHCDSFGTSMMVITWKGVHGGRETSLYGRIETHGFLEIICIMCHQCNTPPPLPPGYSRLNLFSIYLFTGTLVFFLYIFQHLFNRSMSAITSRRNTSTWHKTCSACRPHPCLGVITSAHPAISKETAYRPRYLRAFLALDLTTSIHRNIVSRNNHSTSWAYG